MKKTIFSLTLCLLLVWQPAMSTNLVREAMINRHIRDSLHKEVQSNRDEAMPLELQAGTRTFLGIYREGILPMKQGGAIILHDINQTADSPGLIRTLRNGLIESGWDTLAIQLPVTDTHAHRDEYYKLMDEATARLAAAVDYYRSKNILNIGIVAHGFGGNVAVNYMAVSPAKEVNGIAIIGMDSRDSQTLENLEKITVKILDLFGSEDLPSVLETAPKRQRAVTLFGASANYMQYRVNGANHHFSGLDHMVLNIIRAWKDKHIAGSEVRIGNSGR